MKLIQRFSSEVEGKYYSVAADLCLNRLNELTLNIHFHSKIINQTLPMHQVLLKASLRPGTVTLYWPTHLFAQVSWAGISAT